MEKMNTLRQGSMAAIAAAAMIVSAGTGRADPLGFVGLSLGLTNADNGDAEIDESFNGGFAAVEGAYAIPLGSGGSVVIDGALRYDDIGPLSGSNDSMGTQFHLTGHYLHPLANGVIVGGFAGYTHSPHRDTDPNEDYETIYGGVELIYPVNDRVLAYGQIAIGDTLNEASKSSDGFAQGKAIRVGVEYTGWADKILTAELEAGNSRAYEDESENGEFASLLLGFETPLANTGFDVTAGLRHSMFNARVDNDLVRETTVSVGIRYTFGGQSRDLKRAGIIGTPYIPVRAPNWVPALD